MPWTPFRGRPSGPPEWPFRSRRMRRNAMCCQCGEIARGGSTGAKPCRAAAISAICGFLSSAKISLQRGELTLAR
jgi:hypothetical protein